MKSNEWNLISFVLLLFLTIFSVDQMIVMIRKLFYYIPTSDALADKDNLYLTQNYFHSIPAVIHVSNSWKKCQYQRKFIITNEIIITENLNESHETKNELK